MIINNNNNNNYYNNNNLWSNFFNLQAEKVTELNREL